MPNFKKNTSPVAKKSAYKMYGKSPMTRALVGNQSKLPPVVKNEIANAAPAKMYDKAAPAKSIGKLFKGLGGALTGGGSKFGGINMVKKLFKS